MKVKDLVDYFSEILKISDFNNADISLNGLQVGDVDANVKKLAFAVDASLATIEEAAKQGADMLFVHHGMFWGRPIAITGRHYKRVKTLLDHNMALFACHLPLDANLELGNNAQMAKRLELKDVEQFSFFRGVHVGVKGVLSQPMTPNEIIEKLGVRRDERTLVIGDSKRKIKKVGVVSGDGASDMYDALGEGLDALITGEARYTMFNDCVEEPSFTLMCLGHYETEVFGVKAVQEKVNQMGLETCFIDNPISI
jgi:dinuclear metal center YbgI/SA1388 family protein